MMKTLFLILTTFLIFGVVFGQQPDLTELSKMEGGKRVLEYFKAFNSGDEQQLKDFFLQNLTSEALSRRPVEPRLEFHRELRSEHKTFEIKDIVSINIEDVVDVELLVQGKNGGWIKYTFTFEKNSPQKLQGWQIELTDAPTSGEKKTYEVPKTNVEFLSTTEKYLNDLVSEDKFSGVVLVAKGDKPIFAKAYGLADKEKNVPNKVDTKFNLGSINKTFTQIAIGQLIEQGKISYDDKLGKYLPDYPNKEAAEKVTVRHLLNMSSGVGDFFGQKYLATPKEKLRNINDFIPLFSDKPLAFEPGTKNQYSNGGYILLGAIIEKVTGKSYYDYVRTNIYQPLGMTDTDYFESDKKTPNMAEGYTTNGVKSSAQSKRQNNLDTRPARGTSAGGGYSTAQDLLKFSLALQSGKIKSPEESPSQKDSNGKFMGLGIAGGSPGVNAILEIMPEQGYTIIVLSNYDPPSAEKLGIQIRNWTKELKD
ncbi:MAG TPA: serine hydrolase domain-containing protein [Pyrinomonadaceae bacterium]|nr:serine hydrolase domain-containing protein [Pyrinomonadaceae bacterium]